MIRGAFTISSYLEGTGTNLRLTLNPPFTPAEINANYSGLALPTTNATDGIVGGAPRPPALRRRMPATQVAFSGSGIPKCSLRSRMNGTSLSSINLPATPPFRSGYVGQRGTHLMVPFDYAQRVLLPNSSCATPPCTAPSPYFAANPDALLRVGQRPSATVSGTKSNGTMRYNSLQAVVQKQMTHGLQYQVAYTFSKCMSDSTGYYGAWNNALSASAYWQNVYDQKSEYAPCYYDATNVISAYAIYELPFGRGKMFGKNANGVVNGVIGGWEVSPIVSFRTGWPMPVYGARIILVPSDAERERIAMAFHRLRTHSYRELAVSGSTIPASLPIRPLEPLAIAHRNSQICVRLITATSTSVCIRTSR